MKPRILLIEDDKSIERFIGTVLEANDYQVISAQNGRVGYALVTSYCPDLIILDLGLPDMDGMDIITEVRTWSQVPIIVVSARSRERDKVDALDAGADDYLTKPFGISELMARIRTALRHVEKNKFEVEPAQATYQVGGLLVDFEKHRVTVDGAEVHLTQNEYKLVTLLATYPGRVLTYDSLKREIWGPLAGEDNRVLRVNMTNIRRKIEANPTEPKYILTEIGVGYRMAE